MRVCSLLASPLVLLAVVGCGSDVDLTGVYEVSSNVSSAPCGTDQPATNGPAFLKFTKADLFGSTYFTYDACTDATGTDCSSQGGLFGGFYEPIDGGWLGQTSYSSGAGSSCSLGVTETTALLDGVQLVIDGSTHQDTVDLAADACTPEEAERRADAMPCTMHTRIEATQL